jgi:hypothetical protein
MDSGSQQIIHSILTSPNELSVRLDQKQFNDLRASSSFDFWLWLKTNGISVGISILALFVSVKSAWESQRSAKASENSASAAKDASEAAKLQAKEAFRSNQLMEEAKDNENHYAMKEIDRVIDAMLRNVVEDMREKKIIKYQTLDRSLIELKEIISSEKIGLRLNMSQRNSISRIVDLSAQHIEGIMRIENIYDKFCIIPATDHNLRKRNSSLLEYRYESFGRTFLVLRFMELIVQQSYDNTMKSFLGEITSWVEKDFKKVRDERNDCLNEV